MARSLVGANSGSLFGCVRVQRVRGPSHGPTAMSTKVSSSRPRSTARCALPPLPSRNFALFNSLLVCDGIDTKIRAPGAPRPPPCSSPSLRRGKVHATI